MHGDDGEYYSVVDVDSSQFHASLSERWKKLENALESCSIEASARPQAVALLETKPRGKELSDYLREVYDILFLEEFDDMDKFMKLMNYYTELKHEYDGMINAYNTLLASVSQPNNINNNISDICNNNKLPRAKL